MDVDQTALAAEKSERNSNTTKIETGHMPDKKNQRYV